MRNKKKCWINGKKHRMNNKRTKQVICSILAGIWLLSILSGEGGTLTLRAAEPASVPAAPAAGAQEAAGETGQAFLPTLEPGFQVDRFVLPEGARMLVVVEGMTGSDCLVYAYERPDADSSDWILRLCTPGKMGRGGMSNDRTEGDKTTPIGLFQLNTPFGQGKPLEGFPANYVRVTKNYVWVTETNRLEARSSKDGERVGTRGYAGYYEYVLDAGYNRNAVEKKGSALFLHCQPKLRPGTAGCVEIPREQMIAIMRLYGLYGDGACYIAQAPGNTFDLVYDSYGVNNGLSPEGDFTQTGP